MAYKIATAPTSEPFTTAQAKTWLKIPSAVTAEDTVVDAIIAAARTWAEQFTGRALMTQTIEEYFDCWPDCGVFNLSVAPVQSITSVSYQSGGSYTTWSSANYYTDLVTEPCRIVAKAGVTAPSYDLDAPNVFKVVYVAGYSSAANIPANILHGMRQKMAFMYENREDIPLGAGGVERERSAGALLQAQRIL